ncbi:unnamed protein product [Urochloa humidicola]
MLRLRLRSLLFPLARAGPQIPSPIHHGDCRLLLLSTSAAPFSLEDYLVASCGLAPAKARSASKKALAEASKRSVRAFNELSSTRYPTTPASIPTPSSPCSPASASPALTSADPLFLLFRVDRLEPRLLALRDSVGLSVPR